MTLLCPEPWWAILSASPAPAPLRLRLRNLRLAIGTIILRVLAVQFSGHRCAKCVCVYVCVPPLNHAPSPSPLSALPLANVITIMARTIYVLILHLSGAGRVWPGLASSLAIHGLLLLGSPLVVLTSVWLALITVQLMRKLYLFFQHLLLQCGTRLFAAKLETMFAGASNRLSDPHQIDQDRSGVTLNGQWEWETY